MSLFGPGVLPGIGAGASGVPLTLPASIASAAGLPAGAGLLYQPPAKAGVNQNPYAPVSGKELYDAIEQSGYTSEQKSRLVSLLFPAGFDPNNTKTANKYYAAVTANLVISKGDLRNYTVPTPENVSTAKVPKVAVITPATPTTQATFGTNVNTVTQENSAYSIVSQYLENWGLGSESKKVLTMVTHQGDVVSNTNSLLAIIRGDAPAPAYLGANATKEFQQAYDNAFPGLREYNRKASENPNSVNVKMTESGYQQYSQRIQDTATQYGVPTPNKQEVAKLLNGNVSAVEYQQRVQDIYSAVQNADAGTKAILASEYGINDQDIMGYVATGKVPGRKPVSGLPEMQRQVASAEIQDYANRVGLTGINMGSGQQLADMARLASTAGNQGLGYGVTQIEGSLANAARDVTLTKSLPGSNAPTVNTQALIASQLAGFGGINQVAAQTEVARAEGAKVAPFEKGGGYAESAKGVVGLGSART
jgi:hypothetical protein